VKRREKRREEREKRGEGEERREEKRRKEKRRKEKGYMIEVDNLVVHHKVTVGKDNQDYEMLIKIYVYKLHNYIII
jgi:hypothetical protein